MPENTSDSVLCRARPITTAMTPEVAIEAADRDRAARRRRPRSAVATIDGGADRGRRGSGFRGSGSAAAVQQAGDAGDAAGGRDPPAGLDGLLPDPPPPGVRRDLRLQRRAEDALDQDRQDHQRRHAPERPRPDGPARKQQRRHHATAQDQSREAEQALRIHRHRHGSRLSSAARGTAWGPCRRQSP